MKTLIASMLALGLVSGAASARTVFDQIRDTAPRSDGVLGSVQKNPP